MTMLHARSASMPMSDLIAQVREALYPLMTESGLDRIPVVVARALTRAMATGYVAGRSQRSWDEVAASDDYASALDMLRGEGRDNSTLTGGARCLTN